MNCIDVDSLQKSYSENKIIFAAFFFLLFLYTVISDSANDYEVYIDAISNTTSTIIQYTKYPFEDILIINSTSECPDSYETESIYSFPGTSDKCKGNNIYKGICKTISDGQTVLGLSPEEFSIWKNIKFCSKRLSAEDFAFSSNFSCQNNCGNACLKNMAKKCPISSAFIVDKNEFEYYDVDANTLNSGFSRNVQNFNQSHYFVFEHGSKDHQSSLLINKILVTFNGEPCFDIYHQPKWIEENIVFQNQAYGCEAFMSSELFNQHSEAFLIENDTGDNFFRANLNESQQLEFTWYSYDIFEKYEKQTVFLYAFNRIDLAGDDICDEVLLYFQNIARKIQLPWIARSFLYYLIFSGATVGLVGAGSILLIEKEYYLMSFIVILMRDLLFLIISIFALREIYFQLYSIPFFDSYKNITENECILDAKIVEKLTEMYLNLSELSKPLVWQFIFIFLIELIQLIIALIIIFLILLQYYLENRGQHIRPVNNHIRQQDDPEKEVQIKKQKGGLEVLEEMNQQMERTSHNS